MAVSIPIVSEFDGKGISRAIKEFKQLEGAGAKAKFALQKAALPAAAAIGGLAVVIGDATKAAIEDAKAQALLAQAIEKNTEAGKANVAQAEAFIEKTMMAAAVADDELRPALAQLVQVTGHLEQSQQGVTLALDIAAATGVDLATATDAVAKAYGGNMKALGTLLPGVRDLIKGGASLDEVFQAVAGTVGGAAAVAADTAEGRMKRLSLTIGETKESIGAAFLPILEQLLPKLQLLAQFVQNNTGLIVKLITVVGGIAASILTLNGIMRVYAATLAVVEVATKALDAANSGLNISYWSLGNRLGLFIGIVASLAITIQGLAMDGGFAFKALASSVAKFANIGIAAFEALANSAVIAANYINKAFNAISPIDVPLIPMAKLPRFNEQPFGGTFTPTAASISAAPDMLERGLTMPTIPAISPLTLPAPTGGGGGGGGSRSGGGSAGGTVGIMPVPDYSGIYRPDDPRFSDFTPGELARMQAPVINVTVNAAIAEASLGQTIVDALTDYSRSSGPLQLAIV